MSDIKFSSNASGTGVITIPSPNTNTDRTINLPDEDGTFLLQNAAGTGTCAFGLGEGALNSNTTGSYNVAVGCQALYSNTTASNNTAVGYQALYANTAENNTAIGYHSLKANTTGTQNTASGMFSLYSNTSGNYNTADGYQALYFNTTGSYNVAVGKNALVNSTTANSNTAVGYRAGSSTTTGDRTVFIGKDAGYSNTTSTRSVMIGDQAGYNTTGAYNTFVGGTAGYNTTTGTYNTYVGQGAAINQGAGFYMTTGSKNTIIGGYNGNQGGFDIRAANNNIVLSDGDGNISYYSNNSRQVVVGPYTTATTIGNGALNVRCDGTYAGIFVRSTGADGYWAMNFHNNANTQVGVIRINSSSTSYQTSSDYRLKTDVQPMTGATERLKQLNPVNFEWISTGERVDGFLAHEAAEVVPEAVGGEKDAVDADGNPVYQGIDQSKLVPLLVATIQELEARITALESA